MQENDMEKQEMYRYEGVEEDSVLLQASDTMERDRDYENEIMQGLL